MSDITWRDQGDPDDHSAFLRQQSVIRAQRGDYGVATSLDVAAQCIDGMDYELERIEARHEALLNKVQASHKALADAMETWRARTRKGDDWNETAHLFNAVRTAELDLSDALSKGERAKQEKAQ